MPNYFLNPNIQADGYRKVHREGCPKVYLIKAPLYLGRFISHGAAVALAAQRYAQADGCECCMSDVRE